MDISERYKIIERIGGPTNSKFGEVFLAKDVQKGELVTMKAIRKKHASQLVMDRLKNEALFTFKLEGLPSQAKFIDTPNDLFLIRNYVTGQTIDAYWKGLKKRERLNFIIELFEKLIPIFNHLDLNDVVHADIKPSNILITNDKPFKVHLIDFGLAIQTQKPEVRKMIFPLGYAAPELLLNELDIVSQKTDQFALGITIWRLFCGEMPLTHPNPSIFTNLQLTHPIPEHSKIPRDVFKVIERMCHKHQFMLPPNKMQHEEVRKNLMQAMKSRYDNISDVLFDLKKVSKKRGFLPNNIFSVTKI